MGPVDVPQTDPLLVIGGERVDSESGQTFETRNPATGDHLADVPDGTPADVDRAVEAARTAQPSWETEYAARDRAKCLFELCDLLREHADHLGAIDAADTGNPVSAMTNDPYFAAEYTEAMASFALELKGETPPAATDALTYTLRQPYGVVARIVPFNHPILFAGSKIAAPLVAGNAVILKPPEQASLSALELGRLVTEREIFPDGVFNVVSGFGESVGAPLVTHEDVRKVGFTGGVETGKIVQRQAAEHVTDVSLELGGKNPCIVYPDADLDEVVDGVIEGMNLGWQGESCGSISRLFLHERLYDEGIARIREELERVELGDPLDPETEMGCVTSEGQFETVCEYIERGKESAARLVFGGGQPTRETFEAGYFVEPTLFADVTMDMAIAREEIFGPVLMVLEWSDEETVIEQANDVKYGLTASIYTNDIRTAHRTAERLEAGYVWINDTATHYLGMPFGGWKESGIGREESLDEVRSYTQKKTVGVQL